MKPKLKAFGAAVLGAALVAALLPAASAQAAGGTGCVQLKGFTVCRTSPGGGTDTSIVSEVARQIDKTGKGDTVRAAVYQWTLDRPVRPVADAMVAAKKRGADVKAVVGQLGGNPGLNNPVINLFKRNGIAVHQCRGGCLPNGSGSAKGPDHNRFFLIERDGNPTVAVTSFNFTRFHATQAHNLAAVHGDGELYDFYTGYWNRLYDKSWGGWRDADKSASGNGTYAWVFPRSADPVASQLRQVTGCSSGDRVWVAHANFQSNRPAVRDQLGRVKRLGCDVKVVVLDKDTNNPGWIADATGRKNVRTHDSLRDKFFMIDAEFNGKHREMVYTGTHNLHGNAMKNADDNLLRIGNRAVVDVYSDYYQRLWREAG
ncbi:phospholipase D-like domain-containing protein [Glycomyces buryatensis]|uniref:phospholipase D n=1 Tax=Glycomyces buryatensis TaxID=2570927 RepID=A0A4S8QFW4_9ACTN|nr:phospholipase D-like domain-containing protein [Glycomyces buryatensis]THV43533.1 hypothetical protein FAB82_00255 [Glycomyces buryatensis]